MAALAIGIGAGLLGAGGIMGGLSGRSKQKALRALAREGLTRYGDLAKDYGSQFQSVIDDFSKAQAANIAQYRQDFQKSAETYEQYFREAQRQYAEGYDQAIGEYRTGRESTIALMRQQTEAQQQAARSRNAFTGIGQTSFGQQRVEALGQQGMLREGAIREEYSRGLSTMMAQRAIGMSGMTQQMGTGLAAIQQQMGSGVSALMTHYGTNLAQMGQARVSGITNLQQAGLQQYFGSQNQAAQLSGGMLGAIGNVLGSAGGAVMGAGLSGGFSPASAGAGPASGPATGSSLGFTGQGNIGSSTGMGNPLTGGWHQGFSGMPITFTG